MVNIFSDDEAEAFFAYLKDSQEYHEGYMGNVDAKDKRLVFSTVKHIQAAVEYPVNYRIADLSSDKDIHNYFTCKRTSQYKKQVDIKVIGSKTYLVGVDCG